MAFCVFLLFDCTKHKDELYIYAKVENASDYDDGVEVKLLMYIGTDGVIEVARGEWKGKGFKMVIPEEINPNYLNTYLKTYLPKAVDDPPSTLTITGEKNVKVVWDADFRGYNKDGKQVARFFAYDNAYPTWDGIPQFTYVDSDVTISGYVEEQVLAPECGVDYMRVDGQVVDPILYEWKKTTTFSIEWKKGWNIWRFSGSISRPSIGIMKEEWATTPKNRIIWSGRRN